MTNNIIFLVFLVGFPFFAHRRRWPPFAHFGMLAVGFKAALLATLLFGVLSIFIFGSPQSVLEIGKENDFLIPRIPDLTDRFAMLWLLALFFTLVTYVQHRLEAMFIPKTTKVLFWIMLGSFLAYAIVYALASYYVSSAVSDPERDLSSLDVMYGFIQPIKTALMLIFSASGALVFVFGIGSLLVKLGLVLKRSP